MGDATVTEALERLKAALADSYSIDREIGSGGMAYVYLAEDLKHGRRVALKLLRPELRQVVEGRRFLAEIKLTASLHHPNILPLFDSGEVDDLLYYVMPFIDGETLAERLENRGTLPISEAVEIAIDVAKALDFAHRRGVIHRDVKPGNIMFQAGQPLIGDFGIALNWLDAGNERITGSGVSVGTPEYMSPEQAHADANLDSRSDVYSLASVLYEMLVGEPPFVGDTPFEVLTKVVKGKPETVRSRLSSVPECVDKAIQKALAKDPGSRFSSAADFADALREASGLWNSSSRETRVATAPRKQRSSLLAVAVVALIVTALVLVRVAMGGSAATLSIGQTSRLTNSVGLELDPAISPDGENIAFVAGPLGAMKVHIQPVGSPGSDIGLTSSIPGHHRWPRWSPDGSRIVFVSTESGRSSIEVVSVEGGAVENEVYAYGGEDEIYGASWSPDGTQLVYGKRGGIYTVPVEGGVPRQLVNMVDGHSPSWSPDGSRIAFVSGNPTFVFGTFVLGNIAPSTLHMISLPSGEVEQISETTYLHISPVWTPDGRSLVFVSNHDGSRDIYQLMLDGNRTQERERIRLTAGLSAHTVSLASDASYLTYSVLQIDANIWSLPIPRSGRTTTSSATPVTRGNQTIEGIAVSTDGEWLAFDSNLNGTQDIYRMPVGGGEPERLTDDPHDDFYPAWTRDGSQLAFYSFRSGKREVWTMDADGRNERQVTSGPGQNRAPQWSPDNLGLVYYSDGTGSAELFVVTRDKDSSAWGEPRRLTFDGGFNPTWSPDGMGIAYIGTKTLRVIPAEGGEPRILVEAANDPDAAVPWAVAWSPDGQVLYYKAFDSRRRSTFWSISASGGDPRQLVSFDDPTFQSLRNEFSTDGRDLYFTVSRQESDLWVMDLVSGDGSRNETGR